MRKLLTLWIALGAMVGASISVTTQAFAQNAVAHADPAYWLYRTPYLANRWQIGGAYSLGAGASNSTAGANSIRCMPGHFYERDATLGALGVRINTTSAGGNLQVAIYGNNDTTHRPTGFPIVSSASLSTATAGPVSTTQTTSGSTIATKLVGAQLVWWCSNFDNATATTNGAFGSAATSSLMGGTATLGNLQNTSNFLSGVSVSQTFGTWPDLTSASFTEQLSVAWVNVYFNLSSIP